MPRKMPRNKELKWKRMRRSEGRKDEYPMSKGNKPFDLEDRLIEFAVRAIQVAESLPKSRAGKHLTSQMIRCGTSPAPNYGEAQGAESRSDFIHKMKVCLKELRENKSRTGINYRTPQPKLLRHVVFFTGFGFFFMGCALK